MLTKQWFFLLLWLLCLLPGGLCGKPVNKTVYKVPGKGENLKTLAAAQRLAEKEDRRSAFCLACRIHITLENDHSGRIDFTEEYFLPTSAKTALRPDYTNTFVELILPDGSYRSYRSPQRIPHIKGSMVLVKYTRDLPAVSTLDFLLDLPLALPCKARQIHIQISSIRFEKPFHAILPVPGGKGLSVKKMGRFTYLLGQIPEPEKGKAPPTLRISFHRDWNTFGARFYEKYFIVRELPDSWKQSALKLKNNERLTPAEKLQRLAALLPPPGKKDREIQLSRLALLAEAGRTTGLEVYPALCTTSPSPNLAVAGNIFQEAVLCFQQRDEYFFRQLTGGKLAKLPDAFRSGTALILRGNSCQFRKIGPSGGKKGR